MNQQTNEPIVGIDLGTTNSEIAIYQDDKVTVITDDNGNKIFPSVVALTDDGNLLVGQLAKNQYIVHPERTVLSIKRKMGSDEKITLGDTHYTPQEISAILLKSLKQTAEEQLGLPIKKAVITVPAYFSDVQRLATREAGELAGLEVMRIINEPTAAALTYEAQTNTSKRVLIYDLGGGTFDVSIVSIQEGIVEVIATHGNNHLGGDDFDEKIIEHVNQHLFDKGIDITDDIHAQARIKQAAEKAKITLSDNPYAMIEEEYLIEHKGKPYHLSLELERNAYEEMIKPYIDETLTCTYKALQSSGLKISDIDEIILVGGATRTPIIAERLEKEIKQQPRAEIDPDLCVTMGAAIQGAIINGSKVDAVLVDVTPYTFGSSGFGLRGGFPYRYVYKAIIHKNTPIPVTKSEVFYTMADNQKAVIVDVYQGDDEDALKNIKIGEYWLEGLGDFPENSPLVTQFKLDINGILQVTTKEKKTGLEKSITIKNAMSDFSQKEMSDAQARINRLFEAEEGMIEDNRPDNTITEAEKLIKKAEKKIDELIDTDKEDLTLLMGDVKEALQTNNHEALTAAIEPLADMLFYLEEEAASA